MKAIEKAKIALRKHLLDNKKQVKLDLERMREISNGIDMYSYFENLSSSFSIENMEVHQEESFDYSFDEIESYGIIEELKSYKWLPPDISSVEDNKKDSDILSESFFLIHLNYGEYTKSSFFI